MDNIDNVLYYFTIDNSVAIVVNTQLNNSRYQIQNEFQYYDSMLITVNTAHLRSVRLRETDPFPI